MSKSAKSLNKKKIKISAIIVIAILTFLLAYNASSKPIAANQQTLNQQDKDIPSMSLEMLSQFNGTDPDKPIYLALDGLVYDVTPGREFYEVGGDYHYLAGKDSTKDLKIFGGDIIKKKYNVIAKLK